MRKGFSNFMINKLRKLIDSYDQQHNLKEKKIFLCKSIDRRNEKRREEFVIPEDQPQCPIYKDNRCCGCCDYTPTCDYAVNCNCYGFAYACLGGTDEGAYMREKDYSKYGKIGENGKFDWVYYKDNKRRKLLKIGCYTALQDVLGLFHKGDIDFVNDNKIKYVKIIGEIDYKGNVLVDCSIYNKSREFTVNILSLSDYVYNEATVISYIMRNI